MRISGILFILRIGLLQAVGWWEVPTEGARDAAATLSGRLRTPVLAKD